MAASQPGFGAPGRYVIQSWTVSQGLPQNSVLSLCRTRDGFLWIGTLGGLAQFDGSRFRVFRSVDGNTIPSDDVKFLAEDRSGSLWIASTRTLTRYRAGAFSAFTQNPQFLREGIVDLKSDSDGNIWIANRRGQLLFTDGSRTAEVKTPSEVTALASGAGGGVWAASRSGIFHLGRGKVDSKVWRQGLAFAAIHVSDDDSVIARTDAETYALRNGILSRWPGVQKSWHTAASGARGEVWLGTDAGILLVRDGAVQRELSVQQGLAENETETLLADGNGGIWVGAYDSGLQHMYRGSFTTYDQRDGLPNVPYDMVFADGNRAIWVGANASESHQPDGFLAEISGSSLHRYGRASGLGGDQVMGVASMASGKPIVAVAPAGLFSFANGRFRMTFRSPAAAYPTAILKDAAGNLWFSLHGGALHEVSSAGVERILSEHDGLLDMSIWSLAQDRAGSLWIASSKGVTELPPERGLSPRQFPIGFTGSVYADPGGGVWVGSFQGLRYWDGKSFRTLTQKDGLPSDTVISMIRDAAGNLWAGSANGIFRLRREELAAWMLGEPVRLHVRVFGSADGLLSSQVIDVGQNTLAQAPDGRLWFATTKGLSVVDPAAVHDNPLQAAIAQVTVDGVRQDSTSAISVGPGRHTLKIEYTAPEMTDPSRVRFAYKLDGWDKDWVQAGNSREVSYAGLPPGSFQFHVRAEYGDAGSPASTAGLTLLLNPFFYQTRWFAAAISVAVACLLWLLVRLRIRASERRLEALYQVRLDERNQIARQLHDTLIQDVVGTALGLEALSGRLPAANSAEKEELDSAVAVLQAIIRRGRLALSELRRDKPAVEDLAVALKRAQQQIWRGSETAFDVRVAGDSPAFLEPIYDDVYNIAREAMINAFRHSGASLIQVSIDCAPASIEVSVEDDGRGMPQPLETSGAPGHFGLQTMRERTERIDGQLSIISVPNTGTCVTLRVERRRLKWWQSGRYRGVDAYPPQELSAPPDAEIAKDRHLSAERGQG
jgi:ligand-binding sensor domain-containing protein/signal transduction histidine kinase